MKAALSALIGSRQDVLKKTKQLFTDESSMDDKPREPNEFMDFLDEEIEHELPDDHEQAHNQAPRPLNFIASRRLVRESRRK
jgi:hypothetical protein